ncbi:MAG: hypothetical protein KME50_02115 [Nostoc desertorum CM1-VF14]|jgi:hypothetical protein|nr:hypothetical protein [Nostoc desertorum CM1-VF14]
MHHSLKIKILDLDYIESIVEQDITDVEAEKIVGGSECAPDDVHCIMNVPIIVDPVTPTWMPGSDIKEIVSKLPLTKTLANELTKKLDLSLDLSKSTLKINLLNEI